MTEPTEKKGLSKGCLIALIVGLVLLVMVIAAAVTCYFKAGDIAKFGVVTILTSTKTQIADNPVEGVDTVKYNAMVDAFIQKLNEDELDPKKFEEFARTVQPTAAVERLDSAEVWILMDAMVDYYPELEEFYPEEETTEPEAVTDSI